MIEADAASVANHGPDRSEVPVEQTSDTSLMNAVLDSLIDSVAVITRDGTIVAVNNAWREFGRQNGASLPVIDGIGLNHLTGALSTEINWPSQLALGMESVLSGAAATFELDYPCDGPHEVRWFRMAITRLQNTSERFVVIHRDVTQQVESERTRARAESSLSRAARTKSVERVAGGVAHEFNNMLGVILGHAEHALDNDVVGSDRVDDIVQIQRAAQRSALLVRHLLTFARLQIVAPLRIDVNSAITQQLATLERRVGPDVAITFSPTGDVCAVRIDPAQLELVLTNLCLNSGEALNSGGWIHISTSRESFDRGTSSASFAEYVRLSVTDNGPGIAAEHLPHVFDPFFTSKAADEHAGLGLATIHGAISQVGGFVEIDNSRPSGTRVDVWIPCDDSSDVASAPDGEPAGMWGRTATPDGPESLTVLVVDDERPLLDLTARILRRAGWTVLTADSAEAAVAIAIDAGTPFDLLLTDVVLPGMDGPTLVRTLADADLRTPYLYMSGYPASAVGDGALDSQLYLSKPFTAEALTDKVRSMLNDAG